MDRLNASLRLGGEWGIRTPILGRESLTDLLWLLPVMLNQLSFTLRIGRLGPYLPLTKTYMKNTLSCARFQ